MAKAGSQLALFPELPDAARRRARQLSRVFFALWPDPAVRLALLHAADQIPPGDTGRLYRVKSERYHLTLAFLGNVEARQIEAAMRAAAQVRAPAFVLPLDQVGHFSGANVVWIGPSSVGRELAQLKAELDRELLRFGLAVTPGPFIPHITCLRGVREAPDAAPLRVDWPIREFVLVKSVLKPGASSYKLLGRWPLLGTTTGSDAAAPDPAL